MNQSASFANRRQFLIVCTALGFASSFSAGALYALAAAKRTKKITGDMIDEAAALAGITIPTDKREAMLSKLNEQRQAYDAIRKLRLPNEVPPAFRFDPVIVGETAPPAEFQPVRTPSVFTDPPAIADAEIPKDLEKLAFATVQDLGALIKKGKISVVDLTEMYLTRLRRYDPRLKFLITLTEERARAQAREADSDLAKGRYRGPLHGIPRGAKDLLSVRGYPTTWGSSSRLSIGTLRWFAGSMKQAQCSSRSYLWVLSLWVTNGLEAGPGTRGMLLKAQAAHPLDPPPQLPPVASPLLSAPRR